MERNRDFQVLEKVISMEMQPLTMLGSVGWTDSNDNPMIFGGYGYGNSTYAMGNNLKISLLRNRLLERCLEI